MLEYLIFHFIFFQVCLTQTWTDKMTSAKTICEMMHGLLSKLISALEQRYI